MFCKSSNHLFSFSLTLNSYLFSFSLAIIFPWLSYNPFMFLTIPTNLLPSLILVFAIFLLSSYLSCHAIPFWRFLYLNYSVMSLFGLCNILSNYDYVLRSFSVLSLLDISLSGPSRFSLASIFLSLVFFSSVSIKFTSSYRYSFTRLYPSMSFFFPSLLDSSLSNTVHQSSLPWVFVTLQSLLFLILIN